MKQITYNSNSSGQTVFDRRVRILTIAIIVMMAIFAMRLFYMQVIRHNYYVAQASQEQVKSLIIPATRGEIYAMDGDTPVKLVLNEAVFTVFADPAEVTEPTKIVTVMKRIAGGNVTEGFEKRVSAKPNRYEVIARNVTLKQAALIKKESLKGVGFQKTTKRVYPEGQLGSQVLGFVNAEDKGQYGVEEALDQQLQGKDGMLEAVTDVSNVPLTIGNKNVEIPAKNGRNVVLSLDRNIQSYTEKALADGLQRTGATKGSVLVMDPQTGRVLSMANLPTYNPEKFTSVQDGDAFNNATIMQPYEAGSVMKTFTVAMSIDKGIANAASTFNNTDSIRVDDRVIQNATKGQTGQITIQKALDYSLNTGMVTLAQRLGDGESINKSARNIMYDYYYNKFGLGQRTGIQLAGEAKGEVVSPEEAEGNAVRYSNMSFGQGMNLTMVQVAAGFSSIVNGGKYYAPTVVSGTVSQDGQYEPSPNPAAERTTISAEASAQTKKMIHDARNAFHGGKDRPGYDIGGKTGTSQTLVNGRYDFNQTVGSYLGYGGDSTAKYVIMVQVSAPGKDLGGNTDAMPIFTDISNWMIDYMKLQPNT